MREIAGINWVAFFLLMVGAVTGVACGGPRPEVATPSPTSLPTATPSPSPLPTETPSPPLAPEIAFGREGNLLKIELPGGEIVSIPLQINRWASERVLSPDGSSLAYSTGDGALWIANPDGSNPEEILPEASGVGKIAWSPDATVLAIDRWTGEGEFGHPTYIGLWVVGADGSDPQEVYAVEDAFGEQTYLLGWSPNGRYVLFWLGWQHSASLAADGLELYSIPTSGGERILLGRTLAYSDLLSWSPDGTRLAMTEGGGREISWNKQIVVTAPDGSSMVNLSADESRADTLPSWSPDGRRIAYVGRRVSEAILPFEQALIGTEIWVMDVDGSNKRQLTGAPSYGDHRPLWSSDGEHILFIRVQDNEASFWLMDAEGGDQRLVKGNLMIPDNYYGHVNWDTLYSRHIKD